jgi:putative phosphotransacetylase
MSYKVEIGISNKHLHLSQEDLEKLFGEGYELTPVKDLKQPGQYAADEKVDLIGSKGNLKGIRVLGPVRPETQVELALTDARGIGIDAPIRESGVLDGTPGLTIAGPKGQVEMEKGVIIALRHIHLSEEQAKDADVVDKELVDVKTTGTRPIIFEDVLIRAGNKYEREMHLDTDEANAAGVKNNDMAEIIKK